MRLKRLELFGFKSFAERTVLNFQHDLIGIVGPNGCGKSNVVDAVRWVLGEQRASSMRGGEMVDVIFKGSASRAALAVAEATIVFDNASGTLESRGEEVSVTRRVYRSGEGEYLIDGSRVRLKDVREMLYGTGLGSRGYSVLEQGRIDAILSANAYERRVVFEEAAGISRYRQRKKETESRLKRVEADLLRLEDVVGELEKRERSLKLQAGKARRFVETRDSWRVDGTRLARHELHFLADQIGTQGEALRGLEGQVEERRAERTEAEEKLRVREGEAVTIADDLSRTQAESSELAAEVRALDERRIQLAARVEAWSKGAEEEAERGVQLDQRHGERQAEAQQLDQELAGLETAHAEAAERMALLERQSAELTADHQRLSASVDAKNAELLQHFHDLTSTRNRVQHIEESFEPLAEREERAETRLAEARSEVSGAREEGARVELELQEATGHLERCEAERDACETQGNEIERRLGELVERRSGLELSVARISSRIESLRDWEREREGLESGARELLEARDGDAGPELSSELSGLLADHLHVDTRTARALDVALGARAQSLVVETPEDALRILAWLKERKGGRVSMALPQLAADPSDPGAPAEGGSLPHELLAADGVEGPLLATTRADEGYAALASALLGDVVLVTDPARALELAQRHRGLRFVTAEGDLIAAGEVQGGHVEVTQGPVGRRSSADELAAERTRCESEAAALDEQLDAQRSLRAGEAERLTGLREAVREAAMERSRVSARLDAVRERCEELERAAGFSEREREGLSLERERLSRELDANRARQVELEACYEREKAELAELEEARRGLEAERGQRARDEGEARVEATELAERRGALGRRRSDLERACREMRDEIARSERLAREHAESARRGSEEATGLAQERDVHLAERGQLEERLVTLRHAEEAAREAIDGLRRRSDELTAALEVGLDQVSQGRLEEQRLELARAEVARRAEEDFGGTSEELLAGFEPEQELTEGQAQAELRARVSELKAQMDRLGPVNLEAVEELEEVDGRLTFLRTQRDDVNEARRALEGTLRKLNEESERRFVESFERIREHFRVLFRQLFGGGRAEITLAEGESVLEAGIDIVARPPGREALPISLLSGGQRTLTALALLFSVFRTNTSPFCILDEVDAALDDANIGRFLSMIEHNLGETQYVVVTHNKATMSACQVLYGVTMAVKGVSNVVSVELDEVEEFVPEATGSVAAQGDPPQGTNGRSPESDGEDSASAEAATPEEDEQGVREVELIPEAPLTPQATGK